jgi:nicotinate-nucleotide adenylyltransferase
LRIALYGGSFDPIHIGHIETIKESFKVLDIDKLIIVPTYLNPFKKDFYATAEKRVEWLEAVLDGLDRVEICKYEVDRQKPTPSIDTVEYIYTQYSINKLYFIIGADNLALLHKWQSYDKLSHIVEFVVSTRGDIHIDSRYKRLNIKENISSTEIRALDKLEYVPKIILDDVTNIYSK